MKYNNGMILSIVVILFSICGGSLFGFLIGAILLVLSAVFYKDSSEDYKSLCEKEKKLRNDLIETVSKIKKIESSVGQTYNNQSYSSKLK